MVIHKDPFRQFQEELAALERKQQAEQASHETAAGRAKREFLALRDRYKLTVADVVAFFPEEEGIAYLQGLIAAAEAKPRKTRTKKD
jgi:hypothetical protein